MINSQTNKLVSLKIVAMKLCTCTWIEIMTGAGITMYLVYSGSFNLAIVTAVVFAPLIGFHFAITKMYQEENCKWSRDNSSPYIVTSGKPRPDKNSPATRLARLGINF